MKLIELLEITDELSYTVIWGVGDSNVPLFEGYVSDIPWKLAGLNICKGLEGDTCGVSIRNSDNHGAVMVVAVNDIDEATEDISFDF